MNGIRSHWITGEVIENYSWSNRVKSLRIRANLLPFKAGQFIRLRLSVDGSQVARSYSLVNAPHEADAELFYTVVANGKLSTVMANLQIGDQVEISQPANGFLVLDEVPSGRYLWMFATGTGLGSYLSILKTSQPWEQFEQLVLIHGVPLKNELAYGKLIQQWSEKYPNRFHFISCVTRETNPGGIEGRLTAALVNGTLEQLSGLKINPEDTQVMLCGNNHMISEVREILEQRGLRKHLRNRPGHITTEQYF